MSDLAAKVLAAIEETECIAREAADSAREHDGFGTGHGILTGSPTIALHVRRHNPQAVLRRCTKDREMVTEHNTPWTAAYEGTVCNVCCLGWPCKTMRLLAEGYGIEVGQ